MIASDFRAAGVTLSLTDDGRLTYRAPAGVITPELKGQLTAHRDRLTAELVRDQKITRETVERLRNGQRWLTANLERHMSAGPGGDPAWNRSLTVWDSGERLLRNLLHYQGCIWPGEGVCPTDAPVCCRACGDSGKWNQ